MMTQTTMFRKNPAWVELSPCQRYRYALYVPLGEGSRTVCFVLANPSKAVVIDGRLEPDPTVQKIITYAQDWGYSRLSVVNARAWRATDPDLVPPDPEGIGPDNDKWIEHAVTGSDLVVCGWGKLGGERGWAVLRQIVRLGRAPYALRLNADGSPTHPLYLPRALRPQAMKVSGV
jgi:hypothetical protein